MTAGFVGRTRETALLAQLRARAAGGEGQLIAVTGEAGIGKTWFCRHVATAARAEGWTVAFGTCWPHAGAPPLWPWPAVLADLVGEGADAAFDRSSAGGTDGERFARFSAIARALRRRSGPPALVVLDDAHCADEAALLLTRFLAGALEGVPMVLLLARRTTAPPRHAALLDVLERQSTIIPLRRFDLRDTTAFLATHAAAGPDQAADRSLVLALLRISGGSPLLLARAVAAGNAATAPGGLERAVDDVLATVAEPVRRAAVATALLGEAAVTEVAELAELPRDEAFARLDSAAGLVERTGGRVRPAHELVREALLAGVAPPVLLDLHAAAAAMLARAGAPAERVAHHALEAADRSAADVVRAIDACRSAAHSARRGLAYETAADLLGRAAALAARTADPHRRAAVLVEHAEAVLACGRLAEARAAFGHAADASDVVGDSVLLARAVLGLGGVWVHEHRNVADRARITARQRAALARLSAGEHRLIARLRIRLAAEAAYVGGPVSDVLTALDAARATGDDRVAAEALSLAHHALLAPEHARHRARLAEELVQRAAAAGDDVLAVFGLLWRTVDRYELADPFAERALAELRERTEALGVAAVAYVVACIDVMRLIRAGRLGEAERAARLCLQRGRAVGDADADGYFGVQLATIRWLQGRDGELIDLVPSTAHSPTLAASERAFSIVTGTVLARGGRITEARAALAEPLRDGLAALPRSSTWSTAMVAATEAAVVLGEPTLAAEAAELLRPFADLPVMPSLAVSCVGVAARALGLAAAAAGDLDEAVRRFEQAVRGNDRIAHRPAAALSRAELARALVRRGGRADRERAADLFAEAAGAAQGLDMPLRARDWAARAARLHPADAKVELRRRDGGWAMRAHGRDHRLPDLVGLGYLATLLSRPGRAVSAVELCGSVEVPDQELVDRTALRAYRERLAELDGAIDRARVDADLGRLATLQDEHAAVADEVRAAVGLGGRARAFAAPPERARTAVRKAIKRAVDAIADRDPALGAELRAAVATGARCRYAPSGPQRWTIRWR